REEDLMTTALSATFPLAGGYQLHLELSRARAVILALLVTLCAVLVFIPATRLDRSIVPGLPQAAGVITQAAGAITFSQAETFGQAEPPAQSQPAVATISADFRPEIDALAILVA